MSGDPTNAHLWADADVYVSFDLDTALPATVDDDFPVGWDLVGLLDGDDGFDESISVDKKDHYAWGGILFKTGRRNYKTQKKFTALELNDTTFRLRWPGSTQGVALKTPRPEDILIAFETVEGKGTDAEVKHRVISALKAQVELDGDVKETEADPAALKFVATIFPTSDGTIWIPQDSDDGS